MNEETKLVILDKILTTATLLKRSSIWQRNTSEDNHVTHQLRELQSKLRSNVSYTLNAVAIVSPFLLILRSQYLSGPFKLAALDTLQSLLGGSIFTSFPPTQVTAALSDIVEAVIKCKFQQTEPVSDDVVYQSLIETMHLIVTGRYCRFLTEDAIWAVIQRCLDNVFARGPHCSSRALLVQLSEKTIMATVQCVFSAERAKAWGVTKADTAAGAEAAAESEVPVRESPRSGSINSSSVDATTKPRVTVPFGLQCAVGVMEYFVSIIGRHAGVVTSVCFEPGVVPGASATTATAKAAEGKKGAGSAVSPTGRAGVISAGLSIGYIGLNDPSSLPSDPSSGAGADKAANSSVVEVLVALKAVQAMIRVDGSVGVLQELCALSPALVWLLRDDLGKCLVLLAGKRGFPTVVLQHTLSAFSALQVAVGPTLRVLTETFMTHVYMKALHQLLCCLVEHDGGRGVYGGKLSEDELVLTVETLHVPVAYGADTGVGAGAGAAGGKSAHSTPVKGGGADAGSGLNPAFAAAMVFTHDELAVILDHLSDLLSSVNGLIPSMYSSFDCDPLKTDLCRPLVVYLAQCARFSLLNNAYLSEHAAPGGGEQERYLAERQAEGRLNASGRFSLKQLHGLSTSCRHSVGEVLNKLVLNIPSAEADTDDLALAASSQSRMVAAAGLRVATSPGSPGEVPPALVANYLHSCRESKVLLAEATRLFVDKPKLAFKLLQSSGAAATPLSPQYVARFLRAINNVKDEIGAYIGELGKTDGKELCDSVEFREAVRTEYVNTFHFDGQDLLSCFRIFLSAFRLPGEAQQIDRILVAFSEKCHAGCSEGRSGLLENAEITYLLTFSIIMLNTDCHNPNVRADRKMTVEQFVRNNSNYGKDLNQTRPIPREFLEAIYASIYECPLRTERTDISGELTVDMWMDYQLQSEQVLERGMMVTTFAGPRRVLGLLNSVSRGVALRHGGDDNEATPSHSAPVSAESFPCKGAADVVLRMLTHGAQMVDPVAISEAVHAQHAFVDKEILQCVWLQLVGLGLSPFLSHLIVIPEVLTDSTEHSAGDDKCGAEGSNIVKLDFPVAEQYEHNTVSSHSLRKAVDIFTSMIELSHAHELPNQVDIIITLLADLAGGFLHGKLVDSFVIKYSGELGYSLLSSLQHEYFTNKRRYYATLMPTNPTAPPLSQSLAQRRHSTGDLAGLPASSSRTSSPAPGAALSSSTKGVGKAKSASPGPPQAPSTEEWIHDEFLTDIGVQQRRREIFVNMITESIRARAALGTLLQLVVASPRYVRSSSWVVVWYLLGSLRDCGLLPRDMVLADTDTEDAFPAKCRLEFEAQLKIEALKRERALIRGDERFRSKVALAKQQEEKRLAHLQKLEAKRQLAKEQGPSILSLQGWGEILFGAAGPNDAGGEGVNTHSPPVTVTEDMVLGEWLRFGDAMHHSIIAGRWDSGYEMDGGDSATQLDPVGAAAPARSSTEPGGAAITGHGSADKLADRAALPTGRKTLPVTASVSTGGASSLSSVPELVKVCGTSQLVANSRYFSDEVLLSFVTSILAISEISPLQLHSKDHYNHALTFNESTALMKFLCGQYSLTGVLIDKQSLLPAEGTNFNTFENSNMGVVDDPKKYDGIVSDISGKMAPLDVQLQAILLHVLVKDKTIGKPSSNSVAWLEILVSEIALRNRDRIGAKLWPLLASHYRRTIGTNALTLDYALERRVMGVFRIATRMLARDDHLRDEIMSLLDDLFVHAVSKKRSASVDLGTGASAGTGSGTATHVGACCLYEALSPQIACCMWRFLTANVAILPLLSLRQWQTIFDIIAHTAATTDFAAMKSFECMAWMLHDTRLRAEVPIFCVSAIKPLLRNSRAPLSVCLGAVRLLCLLHERLEILVDSSEGTEDSPDAPSTWETCWVPVLQGLIDGALDERRAVGVAAIGAVCKALLVDRHACVAPPRIVVLILGEMWAPAVVRLVEGLRAMEAEAAAAAERVAAQPAESPDASPAAEAGSATADTDGDEASETLHSSAAVAAAIAYDTASSEAQTEADERAAYVTSVEEAMASLCALFSSQLKRISGKAQTQNQTQNQTQTQAQGEAFDNLWMKVLHVLGIYLHDPQQVRVLDPDVPEAVGDSPARKDTAGASPGGSADSTANAPVAAAPTILVPNKRLNHTHEVAYEQLKSTLMVMIVSGIFKVKPALWARTCEYIKTNFLFCPDIVEQLFGSKA